MALRDWLRRRRLHLDEDDFQDEIRAHLAMAEADRRAGGADPERAHYDALKEFGSVTRTTEDARRVWTPWWLEALRSLAADGRQACRTLAKSPFFTATAVGVLVLGIGLTGAVFTMLKAFALTPVAGVDRSASLTVIHGETGAGRPIWLSYPDYEYLRDHDRSFERLFGTILARLTLGRGLHARQLWAELVTGNYFDALGVRAAAGRTLRPSDEAGPGREPVVMLGYGLWQREFGADPAVVGRTIEVNGHDLTVVGVVAPTYHGTTVVYDVEVYVPVTMAPALGFSLGSRAGSPAGVLGDRAAAFFYPQGFLREGVSREQALAALAPAWDELSRARPVDAERLALRVVPFWKTPNGAPIMILPALAVLTAMGLLVLLIACANIAGLALVRGLSRRGDIAVRLALGASRFRVLRLLVVENLVIAVPGAVLGMLAASNGVRWLSGYAERLAAPERVFFNVEVDALTIGFAAAAASVCTLIFGVAPALTTSRVNVLTVINEDASPRGTGRAPFRRGLVVAQVAVSLLLLVGAGLVLRSLDKARHAYPGFDASHVTRVMVNVKLNGYDEDRGRAFYRDLLDAVRADAGVETATLAAFTPLAFLDSPVRRAAIDGYQPGAGEDLAFQWNSVGASYFRTLRVPLLAGREFDARDGRDGARTAVVNETLARRFWGAPDAALGKRLAFDDGVWRVVVGVAADLKYSRVDEPPRPYVYLPFEQAYRPDMVLHTRGAAPVDALVRQARAHVVALDREMQVLSARPLADDLRGALIMLSLIASMLGVFGLAGMALASMGTYGLVSYTVAQSAREIGIRMALGATRLSVVSDFLRRGMRLGVLGAALGVAAALAAARVLVRVLFGVGPTDLPSYAAALVIVLVGVALATLVPAARAARTSPLKALRQS